MFAPTGCGVVSSTESLRGWINEKTVTPEQEDGFCCGIRINERKINVPRGTFTPGKLA
jgi:hypothetical protein